MAGRRVKQKGGDRKMEKRSVERRKEKERGKVEKNGKGRRVKRKGAERRKQEEKSSAIPDQICPVRNPGNVSALKRQGI